MSSQKSVRPEAGPEKEGGLIRRWWRWFSRPSARVALGTLLTTGIVIGVLGWGGFNWALELTNTENFCISCHEMKQNVFVEYRNTAHYNNRSGVRASCPDCHVPKEWVHKVVRKVRATNELYHHVLGSVSTPEKFNEKRLQLALNEWARMKTTDSHECRNCHNYQFMDYSVQEPHASKTHQTALTAGKTCIDCHRGIAHKLPPNANEAYQKLTESMEKGEQKILTDYLDTLAKASRTAAK
ncbi:MAG: Denitrification system component NirT [Hyphomicrobiaceae bacterium]|nr:MAG: Denitrification system component NirT [Hyphomicrobiaceae bacterium]